MSAVLERVREKYPQYRNVPDNELTLSLGKRFPQYLAQPDFKMEFEAFGGVAPLSPFDRMEAIEAGQEKLNKATSAAEAEGEKWFDFANTPGLVDVAMSAFQRGLRQGEQSLVLEDLTKGQFDPQKFQELTGLETQKSAIPPSSEYRAFNEAEGFGSALAQFVKSPVKITAELLAESTGALLPQLVEKAPERAIVGATAGAGLGSVIPGIGTVAGAGLGLRAGMMEAFGSASFWNEYTSKFMESISEAGYDLANPKSVQDFFGNPDAVSKAKDLATRKGIPIAVFDMVSMGLAGKLLGTPAKTLIRKAGQAGAETAIQSGLGAAGEAAGQFVSGEEIHGGAILGEALGELGPGSVEVATGAVIEKLRRAGAPLTAQAIVDKGGIPVATTPNTETPKKPVSSGEITASIEAALNQPEGGESNAQQIGIATTADGGVRTPGQSEENAPLSAAQGGQGVQPSGQTTAPGSGQEGVGTGALGPLGMGAAKPGEFIPGAASPTSIKNAKVDQERQQRGLPPMMGPARRGWEEVWDTAMAKIDQDPAVQDVLIAELKGKPRALGDTENALLLHRRVDLRNEYAKAARDAALAYEDGRQEDLADATVRVQMWSDKLAELEEVTKSAGTEQGRGLAARKMMVNEDFTLASLELQKRAANNFRPLTTDERAELQKIADDYKAKADALEKHLAEKDARIAELESQATHKDIVKETVVQKVKRAVGVKPTVDDELPTKIGEKLKGGKLDEASGLVQKLARQFVAQGVTERNALIDAVHGVLQGIEPNITRRQTMDAISGYGDFKQLSKDEISVQLRDLKGQMQQVAKLEDMAAGQAPAKTGVERRTPSDEERRLIKQVEEAKKKGGYKVTDPATQLRSALQSVKTRLENQIKDLEHQLSTRQKIVRQKSGLDYDAEANRLLAKRDELKKQFDEMFGKPEMTDAQRLQIWKTRTTNRIAELQEKLAAGDFSKKPKRALPFDNQAADLKHELDKVKRTFHEALMKDRLKNRSIPRRIIGAIGEVLNTSRALITSVDLSAVLRQGGFISFGHPLRALQSFPAMIRALRSEKAQNRVMEEIRSRPNADLYAQSKLYLADDTLRLSQKEEAYMSRWAEKVPLVGASQRAYTTFLNKLRADSFDAMVASMTRTGTPTPEEAKAIANFINVATGRGGLGGAERWATGLNTIFFSPRYLASRFQLLAGQPLYGGTGNTRKLIAGEYGRYLTGMAVVYGLAALAKGDDDESMSIELDPRSSDFGKIRVGNTRIDPMTGLLQITVLASRLTSGKTKALSGDVRDIRGAKVPFGKDDSADVIARFLRTKLSPAFGAAIDVLSGTDLSGQEVTAKSTATRLMVPISYGDIYEAMQQQGVPKGTALAILSIFGMGVQTYEERK